VSEAAAFYRLPYRPLFHGGRHDRNRHTETVIESAQAHDRDRTVTTARGRDWPHGETFSSESVNHDFVRAWAKMPAIVAYARREAHSNVYVNAHSLIEDFVDEAIAKSRKATEPFDRRLAQAVDVLEVGDGWTDVYATVENRAFTVGVALGVYLALNGGGTR
jgi:hypothetical protein